MAQIREKLRRGSKKLQYRFESSFLDGEGNIRFEAPEPFDFLLSKVFSRLWPPASDFFGRTAINSPATVILPSIERNQLGP